MEIHMVLQTAQSSVAETLAIKTLFEAYILLTHRDVGFNRQAPKG